MERIDKKMSECNSVYFKFLKYSLNKDCVHDEEFKNINWQDLYDFAKKQSLLGVIYQGIIRLPQGYVTDVDLLAKWTVVAQRYGRRIYVLQIRQTNYAVVFQKRVLELSY